MLPYSEKMRAALKSFKSGAVMRLDSWVNNATGFGTMRDKAEYGLILPDRTLTDIELSALYHSDDMAARMIDVVPNEMLREGFSFETGEPDLDSTLADKFDDLSAPAHLADGIRWGRCFGGGGILIGADDGRDSETPLVPERAKDLSYLYVIDRRMLWPLSWYDEPGHPKLGQPATYLVTTQGGTHFNTAVCHESRLILFRGAPTGIRERMHLFGWDYSVMQRAYQVLRSFNTGWRSVETLLADGNQAVFKMTGLAEMLASGGEEMLRTRMQAMDLYRSVMRALVIDADGKETFERNSANFSNIPDTLDKFMLRLAASVQIPVTILMGQSPAGMNATGDSDFRWFYDRIRAEQTTILAPKIRRLANIWLKTKAGQKYAKATNQLTIKFPNLWTDTPLVQAQRRLALAQGDDVYVQNQAISPEEVAIHRFAPDGFERELILSPEGLAAREQALSTQPMPAPAVDPNAPPAVDPNAPAPGEGSLDLPATDISAIVTANEARKSVGLPPLPGEDGNLTLPEFKAKHATTIAAASNAEKGQTNDGSGNPHKTTEGVQPDKKEELPPALKAHMIGAKGNPFAKGGSSDEAIAQQMSNQEASDKANAKPNPFAKKSANLDARSHVVEARDCHATSRFFAERMNYDKAIEYATLATAHAILAHVDVARLDAMKPFEMHRDVDESGVSGTGHVADGVEFDDGRVALRWRTNKDHNATTLFDSMSAVHSVHGHGGKTRIEYLPMYGAAPGNPAPTNMDAEWDESLHPRDDHGRFGEGGGGPSSAKGESSSGSGGGSAKTPGEKSHAGEKPGTLYGKGAAAKAMGDPFGHPPPSDSKDNYKPDPTSTKDSPDHMTAAARVGIPGKEAPPPFAVPRLAGLNADERAVESRFADAFEKNPQHFIDAYKAQVYGAMKKDGVTPDLEARKTFGTDDCKNLSKDYAASTDNKALYNVAVHQTANMIAKAAFEQHMAEHVAKLPENERNVLVTAGGCAAGKGFALQNAPTEEVKGALGKAAAVWDTAGEQNSTELGWVQKQTEGAGGRAHYVFVDADPKVAFDRVVSRAQGDPAKGIAGQGRVVDKLLYAESYAIGAKNFKAFADKNNGNPRVAITYINVRTPPPSISEGISKDAQSMTVKDVHESAKAYIESRKANLSPAVLKGATVSDHVWGAT